MMIAHGIPRFDISAQRESCGLSLVRRTPLRMSLAVHEIWQRFYARTHAESG
jgi:hypothetical protein